MSTKGILHGLVKAKMKITDNSRGIARFLEPHDILTKSSNKFQNRHFQSYQNGDIVIGVFRVSETGRRHLLRVKTTDDEGKIQVDTEEKSIVVDFNVLIDGFWVSPDVRRVFTLATRIAKREGRFTIAMIGPSGYGKTEIPRHFAKVTGREFLRMNCAAIRDPEEWFGYREAVEGSTIFVPTSFTNLVRKGDCVIILDEINRLEPWMHNTLFPLLDDAMETEIHNEKIKLGKNIVFVMTMNIGFEFIGTFELDQGLKNRIDAAIRVTAPPSAAEVNILTSRTKVSYSNAESIVNVAKNLRKLVNENKVQADCSVRSTIKVARLVKAGMSMRAAFFDTIEVVNMNSEERKIISDTLNPLLGVLDDREIYRDHVKDDVFMKGE